MYVLEKFTSFKKYLFVIYSMIYTVIKNIFFSLYSFILTFDHNNFLVSNVDLDYVLNPKRVLLITCEFLTVLVL
jgi:hypothetical protein